MATPGRPQGFTSVQRTAAIKEEGDLDPLSFFASIPVEQAPTANKLPSVSTSAPHSHIEASNNKEEFQEIDLDKYQKKLNATKEYINEAGSVAFDALTEGLSTAMAFAGFNSTHSLFYSITYLLTFLLIQVIVVVVTLLPSTTHQEHGK